MSYDVASIKESWEKGDAQEFKIELNLSMAEIKQKQDDHHKLCVMLCCKGSFLQKGQTNQTDLGPSGHCLTWIVINPQDLKEKIVFHWTERYEAFVLDDNEDRQTENNVIAYPSKQVSEIAFKKSCTKPAKTYDLTTFMDADTGHRSFMIENWSTQKVWMGLKQKCEINGKEVNNPFVIFPVEPASNGCNKVFLTPLCDVFFTWIDKDAKQDFREGTYLKQSNQKGTKFYCANLTRPKLVIKYEKTDFIGVVGDCCKVEPKDLAPDQDLNLFLLADTEANHEALTKAAQEVEKIKK